MAEGGFKRASAYELHADTDKMSLSDEVQMQANSSMSVAGWYFTVYHVLSINARY